MSQHFLFLIAPYLALGVLAAGLLWRSLRGWRPEGGGGPWTAEILRPGALRVGLLVLLAGHLLALLFPATILLWNRRPARLLILEITGFAFACLALWGLLRGLHALRHRRSSSPGTGDLVVVTALAVSLVSGMTVALLYRWGTAWGAAVVAPYVHSVLRFSPTVEAVVELPLLARLHILSGLVVIAGLPFLRLQGGPRS